MRHWPPVISTQDDIRTCIDAAVTVGSNVIAGPVYSPTGKTWRMDDAERVAAIDRPVEALRPLAETQDTLARDGLAFLRGALV